MTPKPKTTPQTSTEDEVPHVSVPPKRRSRPARPDPRANRGAARSAGLGAKLAPVPTAAEAAVPVEPETQTMSPEPVTGAEEAALAASSAGVKASSTVNAESDESEGAKFARRVVSVPSVLSPSIAEACSRGGLRRQELVFEAINACHDRLGELVAEDNKPKMVKKGFFEVPAPKATSGGHLSINMRLTATNSKALDTFVEKSGAKGISQLVSVALAAYLDVRI